VGSFVRPSKRDSPNDDEAAGKARIFGMKSGRGVANFWVDTAGTGGVRRITVDTITTTNPTAIPLTPKVTKTSRRLERGRLEFDAQRLPEADSDVVILGMASIG
jgi:hypothetical protein